MLSMPAPGAPFHRLARTAAHRWWRPILGTVVLLGLGILGAAAVAAAGAAAGIIFHQPADASGGHSFGATTDTWLFVLELGMLLPAALLAAHYVQRRPAGTLASVQCRPRWRWLGVCLLVAVPVTALMVTGTELLSAANGEPGPGLWVGTARFVRTVLAFTVPIVLLAAALEVVFRGWVLQAVGVFVRRPWVPIAVQALLYAAAFGGGGPWGFADGLLVGAALGWLAVRTGGLEPGIALAVCLGLVSVGYEVGYGTIAAEETRGDLLWEVLATDLVLVPAYVAAVTLLARRRELATVTPPAPAAAEVLAGV